MARLKKYLKNIAIALDQLVNATLGGDPDMTISGRAGRAVAEGRCRLCGPLCRLLSLLDKDHCRRASKLDEDEGKDQI